MASGRDGSSNLLANWPLAGDLGCDMCAVGLLPRRRPTLGDLVAFSDFLGGGRIVRSCGSGSGTCCGPLMVMRAPSKSSSQLLATFLHSSMDAKAFRRSAESMPPKLSCGLR